MTVQTTSNKAGPYTGNGATVTWGATFRVDQPADLQVILTNEVGGETVLNPAQYTVSGVGDPAGITVTYPVSGAPLASTQKITLLRVVDYDQQTSITNQGGFYPRVIEAALDRIVFQCQQLAEKVGRAVTIPISSQQDPSAVLNSITINAAAAAASAASASATWMTFHNQYLGIFPADPMVDNSGNPLVIGALYYNATLGKLRIYNGADWQDTAQAQPVSYSSNVFSGTGSQTNFALSTAPASVNAMIVSISGVTQRPNIDFTFSGSSLIFTSPPPAGTNNILAFVVSAFATGTVPDGSVSTTKIIDGAVTAMKLAPDIIASVAASIGLPIGQCYLSLSGANLLLSPYNGNKLMIGGAPYAIPPVGVTLSAAGLAANTTYYVYACVASTAITLELATTAPVTDTNGVMIKTGDATRTLVGMVRTNASAAFVDSRSQRFVLSWFNRRPKEIRTNFTANRQILSTTLVEIDPEIRASFLVWAGDVVQTTFNGGAYANASTTGYAALAFDGVVPDEQVNFSFAGASQVHALSITITKSGLSEGYHYVTLLGSVYAYAVAYNGAATAVNARSTIAATVLG